MRFMDGKRLVAHFTRVIEVRRGPSGAEVQATAAEQTS